jgi:hypothetical protein
MPTLEQPEAGSVSKAKAILTPAKPEPKSESRTGPPETTGPARSQELKDLDRFSSGAMIAILRQRRTLVRKDVLVFASGMDEF